MTVLPNVDTSMVFPESAQRHTHQDRVATLAAAIITEAFELARLASGASPTEPELADMLAELATAERACKECVERYAAQANGKHPWPTSIYRDYEDAYRPLLVRREAAVKALTAYALRVFP